MIKAIIVTPEYREYQEFTKAHNMHPTEYPHIHRCENIQGFRDTLVIRIGTWYTMEDCEYIPIYAAQHNIEVIEANI